MRTGTILQAGLAVGLALTAFACRSTPEPNGTTPTDVVVLYTNDNWGETEPCG
jgi:hypothetical protein